MVEPIAADKDNIDSLIESNNRFSFELLKKLRDEEEGNIFFSPLNIYQVVAIAYAGARSRTATQIETALCYNIKNIDLHRAFQRFNERIQSKMGDKESHELSVANAAWVQDGLKLTEVYFDVVNGYYKAGLEVLDFQRNPEEAVLNINQWVSEKTREKIKGIIGRDDINDTTCLILTGAIYFLGRWVSEFMPNRTRDKDFYLLNGKIKKVPTMCQGENFRYFNGEGFKALELPYRGGSLAMVILLPEEAYFRKLYAKAFSKFEKGLDEKQILSVIDALENHGENVIVSLPKLKLDTKYNLKKNLEEMGMTEAFYINKADFSGITTQEPIYISDIIHKAYVSVDEQGTEAAAATAVGEYVGAIREYITFDINRPFVFCIVDRETKAILFVGSIVDPL
jgi:serpin B